MLLLLLVLFLARRQCGTLVPWPGIKPALPCIGKQSLNHWTTREVPLPLILIVSGNTKTIPSIFSSQEKEKKALQHLRREEYQMKIQRLKMNHVTRHESWWLLSRDWRPKPPLFDTVPRACTLKVGQVSSVQSLSRVWLFVTPWTAARQASLSITNSQSLLKLMSIELVMLSNYLILCHPLLFLPSVFPSIRVFSNESVLHIRWPKYWSFSFSISPSNE